MFTPHKRFLRGLLEKTLQRYSFLSEKQNLLNVFPFLTYIINPYHLQATHHYSVLCCGNDGENIFLGKKLK